jgi:hypothetical protein
MLHRMTPAIPAGLNEALRDLLSELCVKILYCPSFNPANHGSNHLPLRYATLQHFGKLSVRDQALPVIELAEMRLPK